MPPAKPLARRLAPRGGWAVGLGMLIMLAARQSTLLPSSSLGTPHTPNSKAAWWQHQGGEASAAAAADGGVAADALAASGRCYALERACLHAGGVVLQAHPPGAPLPVLDQG